MRLSESKKDKNIPTDYKTKKKLDAFEDKCVEYMSEIDKNLAIKEYLEKIGSHLHDMTDVLKRSGA